MLTCFRLHAVAIGCHGQPPFAFDEKRNSFLPPIRPASICGSPLPFLCRVGRRHPTSLLADEQDLACELNVKLQAIKLACLGHRAVLSMQFADVQGRRVLQQTSKNPPRKVPGDDSPFWASFTLIERQAPTRELSAKQGPVPVSQTAARSGRTGAWLERA